MNKNNSQNVDLETNNFEKAEKDGYKELGKLENVKVVSTDKSKKIAMMGKNSYSDAIEKYATGRPITVEEEIEHERHINGVSKSFQRMFLIGSDCPSGTQPRRINSSLNSTNRESAKLDLTLKDHKERDQAGNLKTHPLSNFKGSISEKASEIVT